MKTLYTYTDYKIFLNDYINDKKNEWGLLTKMSDAIGCQRPYLSRCLHQEVHLTMDHAYQMTRFLTLDENESEYFLSLVEHARASTISYKKKLELKLNKLRTQDEELKISASRPITSLNGGEIFYYSTWIPIAIHILTSIPEYQTLSAICEKLNLDKITVELHLQQLESLNLITKKLNKWIFKSGEMHLSKESPLNPTHLNNWRQKAVLKSQHRASDNFHYSVVQSLDEVAYQEIRKSVIKIISDFSKYAGPAPAKEIACFNIDLFKL